jgi:gliding motility-associated-like protein
MIQVTDSDSPDLQAAQVSFVIGYLSAEDRLLFVNQAGLTGSFNPATGVLSITGSASVAVYQTALRSVAFQNNANPRTKAVRRIAFEVSDGSFTSNASTVEINFPNQVPALTGTPPQSLYGNVGPALFPNAVVTDVDDVNLISAQIAIVSGLQAGSDELLFDLQPGISGSFVSTTGLLTLSGSSAIINYQNALRSVRFRNLDPAITTVTRQIQFNVQDGAGTSNSVSTSVAINQPPAISSPPPQALSGPLVSLDVAPLISDPNNNADLTTLAITVPPQSGAVASLSGTVLLLDYTDVEFSGTDQLQVAVCDFLGACGQQILNIEIEGDFVVYNAVSANGDNLNSFFYLRNIKPGNRVTIFNRWGDVVYATSDYDNQNRRFTGISDSGKELPSGTYFYRIEMANMPTRTGFLSLKR